VTVPFACVAVAFLLIYAIRIPVIVAQLRAGGGYDNRNPRDQQAKLDGWARRAVAAHANAFEGFAPFAAAVVIAHLGHADPGWSTALAVIYVVARAIYPVLYIANISLARSIVWLIGFSATTSLFLLPFLTASPG